MGLTDLATEWTECIPIVVLETETVMHAHGHAPELFPFLPRGANFEIDSLFMNDLLLGWHRAQELDVT